MWPLQPPNCISLAVVWQQFHSCHTSTDCWIMEGITSTTTGALGACCAHRGEGSWVSPCLKVPPAAPHSLAPWTGNADPSPEAARAGPHHHHHHPAPGTRSEDKQESIYSCPLLHPCHLFCSLSCAGGGERQDSCSWPSWWRKHDPERSPTPSHAVEVKQRLQPSGFTSLFLGLAEGVDSPHRAFPVAGTHVGATVMSQFRLKRNPIGTSLLKATS